MKKLIYLIFFLSSISTFSFSKEIVILSDKPGEGLEIQNHFKVHVNYRGTLEDGTEFDSSFKRNKPFNFQIGLRQVIEGWEQGILGMKVGGKRTISIPPELAYGSTGAGELIPPNATLIFEIEILNATPPKYKNLYSKEIKQKLKNGLLLIDIRTKDEINKTGKIEESIHLRAFDIKGNFNPNFIKSYKSIAGKDDHVAFISNKGEISSILANGFVEQLGYKNIYTLVGGIQQWIYEGREVTK